MVTEERERILKKEKNYSRQLLLEGLSVQGDSLSQIK